MARLQPMSKSKRGLIVFVAITVCYLTIRVKEYDNNVSTIVPSTNPELVWDFLADFSNMKYLNPTITDFTVLNESGNYDEWKYTVEYTELLSHWPHFENTAIGHFSIRKLDEKYLIESIHKTCLFYGLFCLDTKSEVILTRSASNKSTKYEENIIYQCPVVLSSFCRREVVFQRNAIITNLKNQFS